MSDPALDPTSPPARTATSALRISGAALAVLAVAWGYLVVTAPLDSMQGVIQKVLYVHPPLWFAAYSGFVLTAICSAMYLWRNDERYDRVAIAGAEVGVVFCTLGLISGPIWAKGTWGHWWAWDPRLTVSLLQWFIYLAYLLLRSFTEGDTRTARFAAVYAIAGMGAVPLNYFAIELFGGAAMHPDNLEGGSLGDGMGWPFLAGVLVCLAAFVHLVILRTDLESRRAVADDWEDDPDLGG